MKKFVTSLVALAMCITTCVAFSACKSTKISYGKVYSIKTAEFMGFSGPTSEVELYLQNIKDEGSDETNTISPYIELATRISMIFNKDNSGKLIIKNILSLEILANNDSSDGKAISAEIERVIAALEENGSLDSNGNLSIDFSFTKNKGLISIDMLHTGVENFPTLLQANGNDFVISQTSANGDISLNQLITLFTSNSSTTKIENADKVCNLVVKNGKIKMTLTISIKTTNNGEGEMPGVYSDLHLTLGK